MVFTAIELGHDYLVLTDHSPRLTVANGLSRRAADQAARRGRRAINEALGRTSGCSRASRSTSSTTAGSTRPTRCSPGSTSWSPRCTPSCGWTSAPMTRRMVGGRVATRAPTCSATAPAGWSRATAAPAPRARSTPRRSSRPAPSTTWRWRSTPGPSAATRPTSWSSWRCDAGCLFSIDSDAHAPGQLDFLVYGCARAERLGVPLERIVNTWALDRLLAWARPA